MASWYANAAEEIFGAGAKKLHSNQAINSAFDFAAASGRDVYNVAKRGLKGENLGSVAKEIYKQGDNWNYGRIAGSYVAASSTARVVSGGGLTKDRNGNNDIIGIPGI